MSGVAPATGSTAVARAGVAVAVTTARAPTLLPKPDLTGMSNLQDALSIIYAIQTKQGQADVKDGEVRAQTEKRASEAEYKRMMEAIAKAREAERESHGFWASLKSVASSIAKVASVVAGVAAIVASGGAALPLVVGIAALTLSAGGMAIREFKLLGSDSDKIGMGMEVAGAAIGVGGCVAGALGAASAASDATAEVAQTTGAVAQTTNGAATVAAGAATIRLADIRHDGDLATADAEDARFAMERHHTELQQIIDAVDESQKTERDSLESTRKAIEACGQAADVAIAGLRG